MLHVPPAAAAVPRQRLPLTFAAPALVLFLFIGVCPAHAAQTPALRQWKAPSEHREGKRRQLPLARGTFTVRYAFLDPMPGNGYLEKTGIPMLRSSLCLSEKYLAPALLGAATSADGEGVNVVPVWSLPSYVIYTDNQTTWVAMELLKKTFSAEAGGRVRLVNLDEDPEDAVRMSNFTALGLDAVNFASVRRTLADAVYLDPGGARLLLGTDVSFLAAPTQLLSEASNLPSGGALYMVDDKSFGGMLYTLPNAHLPVGAAQCPGLLGDFVYLAPGAEVTLANLEAKLRWYADFPRTSPPCKGCEKISAGLHGIDQFGLMLAVAEAVSSPAGGGKSECRPLNTTYYNFYPASPRRGFPLEAVHDKVISTCGMLTPNAWPGILHHASPFARHAKQSLL